MKNLGERMCKIVKNIGFVVLIFLGIQIDGFAQMMTPEVIYLESYTSGQKQFIDKIYDLEYEGKIGICEELFLNEIKAFSNDTILVSSLKWNYVSFLLRNIYTDKALEYLRKEFENLSPEYKALCNLLVSSIYAERSKSNLAKNFILEAKTYFENSTLDSASYLVFESIAYSNYYENIGKLDSSKYYLNYAGEILNYNFEEDDYRKSFYLKLLLKREEIMQKQLSHLDQYSIQNYRFDWVINQKKDEEEFNKYIPIPWDNKLNKYYLECKLANTINKAYFETFQIAYKPKQYGKPGIEALSIYPGAEYEYLRLAMQSLDSLFQKNPRKYAFQFYRYLDVKGMSFLRFAILYDEMYNIENFYGCLYTMLKVKNFLLKFDYNKYKEAVLSSIVFSHRYLEDDKYPCLNQVDQLLNYYEKGSNDNVYLYRAINYYNLYKNNLKLEKEKDLKYCQDNIEKALGQMYLIKVKNKKAHPVHYLMIENYLKFLETNKLSSQIDLKEYTTEFLFNETELALAKTQMASFMNTKFLYYGERFITGWNLIFDTPEIPGLYNYYSCDVCGGNGKVKKYDVAGGYSYVRCSDGCDWLGRKIKKNYKTDKTFYLYGDHETFLNFLIGTGVNPYIN